VAREVVAPVSEDPEGDTPKRGVLAFFKELPVLIALALGIALLIKAFLVQAFFIPSASMEPTLQVGDRVLVNKLTYRFREPKRDDVIVFRDPYGDPCQAGPDSTPPPSCERNAFQGAWAWFAELFGLPTDHTRDFIKRIVALPGESIELRDGQVYVDGELVEFESDSKTGPQNDDYNMPPFEVPEDSFYVLGDNRANSSDSRTFRAISRDSIVGKAFVVVWPPNRFKGL